MKYILYIAILGTLVSACSPSANLQVTRLGFEPDEVKEKVIYALPQTVLKITVHYEKNVSVPGPYAIYGEKFLGLNNCITKRKEQWNITGASITDFAEVDPEHFYVINILEGSVPYDMLDRLLNTGYITDGSVRVDEDIHISLPVSGNFEKGILFPDVTTESFTGQREETMYKTIVTDTSFVRVPVTRTILERKTMEKKAEEAANFLLELRLSRFELLSGYVEVFPDGEAMEATLNKMDDLEDEYLSLFTGKHFTQYFLRDFYLIPEPDARAKKYRLALFSDLLGFVPATLGEGSPVEIEVIPSGKTVSLRNLIPQTPVEGSVNQIYYRLPDVADVVLSRDGELLHQKRLNIFQSGALVSVPVQIQ